MHEFVQQLVRLANKDQSTPNIEQPHLFEWLQQPQLRTVTGLSKGEPMPVSLITILAPTCFHSIRGTQVIYIEYLEADYRGLVGC